MAIIKCEDCGKEISDKASACIHCGCPIVSNTNDNINIVEDVYNVASIVDNYGKDRIGACKYLSHTYGLSLTNAKKLIDEEHNRRNSTVVKPPYVPYVSKRELTKQRITENKQDGIACCPKCGSTSLSANKKGFGIGKAVIGAFTPVGLLGLTAGNIGAKKVLITCMNCGHQFKPGK